MKKYLIPLIVFVVFLTIYIGYSEYRNNNYLFMPVWDIKHYLDISLTGYEAYPCTPGVNGPAGAICGNPGWFPAWPLLIKTVRPLFGDNSKYAFNIVPQILTFLGLTMLFAFIRKRYDLKAAILVILAVLFNPSGFYWITGFPYALLLFLFGLYIWLLYAEGNIFRHIGLFLTALVLSLTYPTGFVFAILPLIKHYRENRGRLKETRFWLKLSLYIIPFALGPIILFSYFYFEFNDFWLHLHFQAKYNRTWAFPLWIMVKSLFTEPLRSPENITILWYTLAVIIFYPFRVKAEFWILALILLLFSLTTGTTMSIYRHYLIALPVYMIIGCSTRPLWLRAGFIAVGLVAALTIMFPTFINYRLM